jgi:protease-4
MAQIVQAAIGNIYTDFKTKAAEARKTTPEKIDEVAQGRVWTGNQAKERGLVDRLGSYTDAIKSATTRGKLTDDARIVYIETDRSSFERLLEQFGWRAWPMFARAVVAQAISSALPDRPRRPPSPRCTVT